MTKHLIGNLRKLNDGSSIWTTNNGFVFWMRKGEGRREEKINEEHYRRLLKQSKLESTKKYKRNAVR